MKKHLKILAVAVIALSVSGVADTAAYAFSKSEVRERKDVLRDALSNLIEATELQLDALDILLSNPTLSRAEERALLNERRMLATSFRRMKTRRDRMKTWGRGQVNYWASFYFPVKVSYS